MYVVEISLVLLAINLALVGRRIRRPRVVNNQTPVVGWPVVFRRHSWVGNEREKADRHRVDVTQHPPRYLFK